MKHADLVSEEWCDIIFEHKNKDYGAYRLRMRSGRRYRYALLCVLGGFLFFLSATFLLRWLIYYEIKQELKGLDRFGQVNMPRVEKGHELKAVATGRRAARMHVVRAPNATRVAPEIVSYTPAPFIMGEKGLPDLTESDMAQIIALKDTTGLENDPKAPEVGPQLTPTEVVEQMPQFPGGPAELMKWLDAHIPYPPSCIKAHIEGEMEVTFLVAPDGSVLEPAVSKKLHPQLDRIVLGALKVMPKWQPGKADGKPILVRVSIPIVFSLD